MQTPAVELEGLTKDFYPEWGGQVVRAVDNLSFVVGEGKVFGLLGPNGSGKSTTLKLLLGLLSPTRGSCRIFGLPSGSRDSRRNLGYLPESPNFYRFLTGSETVRFFGELSGMDGKQLRCRVGAVLEQVGLEDAAGRRLETYSKGMLQRVGLAQALVHDPLLVILDEPTAGVDPLGAETIARIIRDLKAKGRTVILCSHLLSQVETLCDEVVILFRGRIMLRGPVDKLLERRDRHLLEVSGWRTEDRAALQAWLAERGGRLESERPWRTALEALFLETARRAGEAPEMGEGDGQS